MNNQSPAEGLRQDKKRWGEVIVLVNRLLDVLDLTVEQRQALNDTYDEIILDWLTAYAATVEREARIDEMLHTTYLLGQGYCRCNHLPDGDTEFIPQADRLAALQGPREEPDGE